MCQLQGALGLLKQGARVLDLVSNSVSDDEDYESHQVSSSKNVKYAQRGQAMLLLSHIGDVNGLSVFRCTSR